MQTSTENVLALEKIHSSLIANDSFIPIFADLKLTKTRKAYCESILSRDLHIEQSTFELLNSRISEKQIYQRYSILSPNRGEVSRPAHFAAKVLAGRGAICSGENIFLFFPECLDVQPDQVDRFFGIELIDVWSNIFNRVVFPCVKQVFDLQTQLTTLTRLEPILDEIIYLAAVFHEIGHQIGPWRVSPIKDPANQVSQFHLDILGELYTDSLLVQNLKEFDEIFYFVLLQRLFWFGRRGFSSQPQTARINYDNDSLISAILWNSLEEAHAIKFNNQHIHLDIKKAKNVFANLVLESNQLGLTVLAKTDPATQDAIVNDWLKSKVNWTIKDGFTFCKTQQDAFSRCLNIEEIPLFQPLMDYRYLGELHEKTKVANY